MRLSLLFSTFATIAVAAILPSNEFELGGRPLKPRTLAGAKNLFNRQDTCATDKICGNLCCYSEYYCSPEVTCQLIGVSFPIFFLSAARYPLLTKYIDMWN